MKRNNADETAADADDEKDIRDESILTNRFHRYHHQLSTSSHHRLKEQTIITSEDDDEELLLRNHRGMMDFMDRVSQLEMRHRFIYENFTLNGLEMKYRSSVLFCT